MMRCLIVDDEQLALDLLEDNLKHVNYLQVVGRCHTAGEALILLQTEQIDLLFCDIHMPGLNGLQLVKSLIKKPMVIFVTAYEKFAIDGYDLDVIDYLVKPVPLERFLKACHKARDLFELKKSVSEKEYPKKNHFFIHADYNLLKINFNDIEYIEGLKDYVKINLTDKERPIIARSSLKALELQLAPDIFFRVHNSFLINIDYIEYIRRGKIKMKNAEVPLSDKYRDVIDRIIGKKVEE